MSIHDIIVGHGWWCFETINLINVLRFGYFIFFLSVINGRLNSVRARKGCFFFFFLSVWKTEIFNGTMINGIMPTSFLLSWVGSLEKIYFSNVSIHQKIFTLQTSNKIIHLQFLISLLSFLVDDVISPLLTHRKKIINICFWIGYHFCHIKINYQS